MPCVALSLDLVRHQSSSLFDRHKRKESLEATHATHTHTQTNLKIWVREVMRGCLAMFEL